MRIDSHLTPRDLLPKIDRMFELSAGKIRSLEPSWPADAGAPVFTVEGRYQSRGWTEWTQGFQFGSAILQFDATGDAEFLELGRARTVERDGAAPDARRRARPRFQQRQHLRQLVAADSRGPA